MKMRMLLPLSRAGPAGFVPRHCVLSIFTPTKKSRRYTAAQLAWWRITKGHDDEPQPTLSKGYHYSP